MPHMPTLPLHHGCAASHSTASYPSSVSASVYSSSATPGELPVPRTSSRQSANPRAASHSPRAVSLLRRQLSLPYGIISRMTGKGSLGRVGARERQPQVGRQLEPVADGDADVPADLVGVRGLAGVGRALAVGHGPESRAAARRDGASQGAPRAAVKNATRRGSYSARLVDDGARVTGARDDPVVARRCTPWPRAAACSSVGVSATRRTVSAARRARRRATGRA